MNRILKNYPRLHDWANIGPVQRAELEAFLLDFLNLGSGITCDGKFVKAGDKVWVLSSLDMPTQTTVRPLEHQTNYYLFGQVPVKHSWSSRTAAINYLREKRNEVSRNTH